MCRRRRPRSCIQTVTVSIDDPPWSLASLPPRPKSLSEKWHPSQQNQAGFFKLPAELRQLILHEAFGGRTLHLDVRSRTSIHPLSAPSFASPWETHRPAALGWRRLVPWFWPKSYRYALHSSGSLEELPVWKWYGCFCHRGRVVWDEARLLDEICNYKDLYSLFSDGCWRGGPWCCKTGDVDARVPDDARVAAMGFLLSCKRACDEALHILYSTNTIWIEKEAILQGLLRQSLVPGAPMLLSPSISLITSLKVRSHLILWRSYRRLDQENDQDRAEFAEQLGLLPCAFPNLERAEWITGEAMYSKHNIFTPVPQDEFDEVERLFLGPLLRASAKLPRLRELIVSLWDTMFFGVVNRLDTSRWQNYIGQTLGDMRVWYPLTEQPGNPGPDGGGFWMVYNGRGGDILFRGPIDRLDYRGRRSI